MSVVYKLSLKKRIALGVVAALIPTAGLLMLYAIFPNQAGRLRLYVRDHDQIMIELRVLETKVDLLLKRTK